MKTRYSAAVLGLVVALGLARTGIAASPGVHDAANMFSAKALKDADAKLTAVQRQHQWEIVFETIDSLDGKDPERLAKDKGVSLRVHGVFFLIAKKESKIRYWFSEPARAVFDKSTCEGATEKLIAAFKKKEFDRGLMDAVDHLTAAAAKHGAAATATRPAAPQPRVPAHAAPDPGGRGSFLTTILIIGAVLVGVLLLVRVLSAVASGGGAAPGGYGGGGGGGGGFFGSMLGGLGGVFLGNWLYDTFSGRSRSYGGESMTDAGSSPTSSPGFDDRGETGGGDWSDSSGDADAGGGDTGGSDGGDFGGGDSGGGDSGGGDFGGGDFGGGDFGGGGGGDW